MPRGKKDVPSSRSLAQLIAETAIRYELNRGEDPKVLLKEFPEYAELILDFVMKGNQDETTEPET
ncbi:hypothetical protein Nos7524_3182 [Nostoc sp. PCC 7524]|uniref:hypothetical protein n=1 Tax=Nostoc sp. (strain ATCC 29411 / PCC 7524) TaxID=28072 RepID=UPI00029EF3EE|nr:hypothetical protein [Nostoc sp. PCC 7524]AFY48982.1 hypothetical protein Nos7524_3182 [Nostoc sp. PCC 7524]